MKEKSVLTLEKICFNYFYKYSISGCFKFLPKFLFLNMLKQAPITYLEKERLQLETQIKNRGHKYCKVYQMNKHDFCYYIQKHKSFEYLTDTQFQNLRRAEMIKIDQKKDKYYEMLKHVRKILWYRNNQV